MLLFKQNSCEVNKLIYANNEKLYTINHDIKTLIMTIETKNDKKSLIIFKNRQSYIQYKKYNKLIFKFSDIDNYNNIKNKIKLI